MPATLRDVARIAGVHPGTASRAMNPSMEHLVNPATSARVRKAAEELGYVPNSLARSLKTNRTLSIGVLVPDIADPLFPPVVRGIEDVAAAGGFHVLVANTDDDDARGREQVAGLRSRQVDGLVIASERRDFPVIEALALSGMPVVLLNRVHEEPAGSAGLGTGSAPGVRGVRGLPGVPGVPGASGVPWVAGVPGSAGTPGTVGATGTASAGGDVGGARGRAGARVPGVCGDEASGVRQALVHLYGLGHRRIAHLAGPAATRTGSARAAAFRLAGAELGLRAQECPVVEAAAYRTDDGLAAARALFARESAVTAVLAADDRLALGCFEALAERGLHCPGDVSVVGFNDLPLVDRITPALTTVRLPRYACGAEAARLLIERLRDPSACAASVVLPVSLVVRGSTGAVGPRGGS